MTVHTRNKQGKILSIVLITFMVMSLFACGKQEESAEHEIWPETDTVAVAEFRQMNLPIPLEALEQYTTNGKWFYIIKQEFGPENVTYQILRGKMEGDYEGEVYLSKEDAVCLALAVDKDSHCFALWKEESGLFLEKYDESGALLWRTEQDTSQWDGIGRNQFSDNMSVTESIVTTDGRLVLYIQGTETKVALFDESGKLLKMITLEPGGTDGIVAGRDGHIYTYCVTGEGEPAMTDVEDTEQCYVLPFRPLHIFSGMEEGIYLSNSEGLWLYDLESGQAKIKWRWLDEYINVDYYYLHTLFCGDQEWYLLGAVPYSRIGLGGTRKMTVVSIREESRENFGPREVITLGYVDIGYKQTLEMLVNLYNRQSRKYRVELVPYEEADEAGKPNGLELQLLRGEGPDLIEVSTTYAGSLADKGVLCDLSDYYARSQDINEESILDVVWDGMQYRGDRVLVIPSFRLVTWACKEPIEAEEWTPEKLFCLADEQETLWQFGTSFQELFAACMGRSGEYERYIDYERRESHFDCSEFRWILENCARAGGEVTYPETVIVRSDEQPGFLYDYVINNMTDYFWHCKNLKDLECSWVGYPSWDGAVHQMQANNIFAMNQKSKNKEGAWDFLQYILSEECQNQIDWGFPVREDSFEIFLRTSYPGREDHEKMVAQFHYSTDYFVPTEEDFEDIRYMVSHSVISKKGGSVRDILYEEVGMYFAGDATLEETTRKIDNRVTLYLNE